MNKIYFLASIALMLILNGCAHRHDDDSHGHSNDEHANVTESETDEHEGVVHLLQKQIEVMGVELNTFKYLNLTTSVKSNGQLELPPQNEANVSALMGGRVKQIAVVQGDYVKKGQLLAQLEHPEFIEMQEQYMSATSRLEFLEIDYKRQASLLKDSIIAAKEFQELNAEFKSTLAEVNALKAKLKMIAVDPEAVEAGKFQTTIPVRSPISGYVKNVKINMGKYVETQIDMFDIVDNDHIHIDLKVYEQDINKVKNGQKVIFTLSSQPDSVFEGSIFAMGRSFEDDPKAMIVHAEIDNRNGNLLPGMYVDARIIIDRKEVRSLPEEAIVSDGGLDYIFVLQPDMHSGHEASSSALHRHGPDGGHDDEYIFKQMEVNTGAADIGFTEVVPVDPLGENVQIVTKGAYYLLAEMKKGEGGNGHHH